MARTKCISRSNGPNVEPKFNKIPRKKARITDKKEQYLPPYIVDALVDRNATAESGSEVAEGEGMMTARDYAAMTEIVES